MKKVYSLGHASIYTCRGKESLLLEWTEHFLAIDLKILLRRQAPITTAILQTGKSKHRQRKWDAQDLVDSAQNRAPQKNHTTVLEKGRHSPQTYISLPVSAYIFASGLSSRSASWGGDGEDFGQCLVSLESEVRRGLHIPKSSNPWAGTLTTQPLCLFPPLFRMNLNYPILPQVETKTLGQ